MMKQMVCKGLKGRAASILLAVMLTLLMVLPTLASTMVPFKGDFAGSSAFGEFNFPFLNIDVAAEGNATHLGYFQVDIPHKLNVIDNTVAGQYIFTAANGDQVHADFVGQAAPAAEPGYTDVAIEAMITGGNGRFADASGTFTVNVQVEEATGNVEGNFEGLISQP